MTDFQPQLVVVNQKIWYDERMKDGSNLVDFTQAAVRQKEGSVILAEKIMQLRRQNGWSQEELANRLEVSRQAVSKWEGGASIPELDKVLKMSVLFGVSTDYLLKDELEQPESTVPAFASHQEEESLRSVSLEQANEYFELVHRLSGKVAMGVSLCVLSPIPIILLGAWSDGTAREAFAAGLGVILLLALAALGLTQLIPAGLRLEEYDYLEKEVFALGYGAAGILEQKRAAYAPDFRRKMAHGVVMCVLAVVPLFGAVMLGANDFWMAAMVCLLLAIVAEACYGLVSAAMIWDALEKLLQLGDYTVENKKISRRVGWFASSYWCVTVAVYLGASLLQDSWKTSWIIFPVAGVLFAALYTALRAWAQQKE